MYQNTKGHKVMPLQFRITPVAVYLSSVRFCYTTGQLTATFPHN